MRSRTARRNGRVKGRRSRKSYREHRSNNGTGRLANTPRTRKAASASRAATDREKTHEARKRRRAAPVAGTQPKGEGA